MAKRFQKAREFVQSDQFGNVIDFFQASGIIAGGSQSQPMQPAPMPQPKKPDYTPLYILGAIAVLVAIIKK